MAMSAVEPQLAWSSRYSVGTAPITSNVPGDKITLPPSALEALLSASSQLASERARRDLPAFDPYNSSTYSSYRRAESEYQDQKQQLPYPLTFRLVNPQNGHIVYAGIQEFTAEEGQILLSSFLRSSLGLSSENQIPSNEQEMETMSKEDVTVHFRPLPKATFVKLRPLEAGYNPQDWKALLEQYLRRNYTTLTKGEMLVVPGTKDLTGKREEYRFLVDGFKPEADGVCIVDTDLEVDIEALNEEQARETLKRIAEKMQDTSGKGGMGTAGGEIDIHRPRDGRIDPGTYVDYDLMAWSRTQPLEIELHCDGGELDLLVNPMSNIQRVRPRLTEHVMSDCSGRATKRIRLEPSNVCLDGAETLQIAIHSFDPSVHSNTTCVIPTKSSEYTLRIHHPDTDNPPTETIVEKREVHNDGDVRCANCDQFVPQRTLMLHENFCLRNNIKCPKGCGQVFQKRSSEFENHWHCPYDEAYGNTAVAKAKHDYLDHPAQVLHCPDCSTVETFGTIASLAHHRTSTCPAKLILCRFCHLEVPQEGDPDVPNGEALLSGLTPHELADGSRTTECHLCNRIVKLRDMETHMKNHDLDRRSRPSPHPCRNANCGRTLDTCSRTGDTRAGTRMGQGPGNDVGLCSVCFGPLYVSMYDPENKALRRRVERRYLQQLLTGCGKDWCRNEFCKTGRAHLDLNTNISTKEALPMIKPFLDNATRPATNSALHFCVEETSQKRRTLANMLTEEPSDVTGKEGYGFEWCLGALEAVNGNLDEARQWLKNWAPTRAETM